MKSKVLILQKNAITLNIFKTDVAALMFILSVYAELNLREWMFLTFILTVKWYQKIKGPRSI